jgi:hypothetical protein
LRARFGDDVTFGDWISYEWGRTVILSGALWWTAAALSGSRTRRESG